MTYLFNIDIYTQSERNMAFSTLHLTVISHEVNRFGLFYKPKPKPDVSQLKRIRFSFTKAL